PHYNFETVPRVHSEDAFWHEKNGEDAAGHAVPAVAGGSNRGEAEHPDEEIHMPSPSYYPALTAFGLFIALLGFVYLPVGLVAVAAGVLVTMWGFFGWSLAPLNKD